MASPLTSTPQPQEKAPIQSEDPTPLHKRNREEPNGSEALPIERTKTAAANTLDYKLRLTWCPTTADEDRFLLVKASPLHIAAASGQNALIKELLAHGASVNRGTPDYPMFTPLELAIRGEQFETVQLLIEKGATLNFSYGKTALHIAATTNSEDLVDLFLGKGLDINAKDDARRSPIHFALRSPNNTWRTMVPYLIQRGAQDQDIENTLESNLEGSLWLRYLQLIQPIQPIQPLQPIQLLPKLYPILDWKCTQMAGQFVETLSRHEGFGTIRDHLFWNGNIELIPIHHRTLDNLPDGILDTIAEAAWTMAEGKIDGAFECPLQLLHLFQIARLDEQWVSTQIPPSFVKLVDALVSYGFTLDIDGVRKLLFRQPFDFESLESSEDCNDCDDSEADDHRCHRPTTFLWEHLKSP